MDLVQSEFKISDVLDRIEIPEDIVNFDEAKYGLPAMIVMNWMLPAYPPPTTLFGEDQTDGHGYSILIFGRITKDTIAALDKALEAGVTLEKLAAAQGVPNAEEEEKDDGLTGMLTSWMWGDSEKEKERKRKEREERNKARDQGALCTKKNPTGLHPSLPLLRRFIDAPVDSDLKGRLKAITRICNLDDCEFNSVIKPIAKQYNGVPFLVKECTDFRKIPNAFLVSIDVHLFSNLSKQGLAACKEILTTMIYDVCMIIQGETDDELPERMVMGCRINMMDLKYAADFTKRD